MTNIKSNSKFKSPSFAKASEGKQKSKGKANGYTLIEILIALPITIAVLAAAFWLWWNFVLGSQETVDYGIAVDAAEAAVIQVVRDLRQVQVSETGAYPLIQLDDQRIAFYADVDTDGVVEKVEYVLLLDRFERQITEPTGSPATYPTPPTQTQVLVSGVVNDGTPLFLYYDSNWPKDMVTNPLVAASRYLETRLVRVQLTVAPLGMATTNPTIAAQRSVALRELKTNH